MSKNTKGADKNTKISNALFKALNAKVANAKVANPQVENPKGADYRAILEEFIRNRNPREFSNAAILGTQERAPRNRFDIGGPLGNIADVFANFSQGRIQDQKETNKLNSLQKFPDEFLSLVAPYAIGGKDFGDLALGKYKADQDALLKRQALNEKNKADKNPLQLTLPDGKIVTAKNPREYEKGVSELDSLSSLEGVKDNASRAIKAHTNYFNNTSRLIRKYGNNSLVNSIVLNKEDNDNKNTVRQFTLQLFLLAKKAGNLTAQQLNTEGEQVRFIDGIVGNPDEVSPEQYQKNVHEFIRDSQDQINKQIKNRFPEYNPVDLTGSLKQDEAKQKLKDRGYRVPND